MDKNVLPPSGLSPVSERSLSTEKDSGIPDITELIHHMSDAVIASDGDFIITFWNSAAERIYGWTAAEAIGKRGPALLRTRFTDQLWEEITSHSVKEGGYHTEVIHYHKNGKPIPIESFFTVVKDKNGKIIQFVSVNRDISERKIAEAALHEAKNELEIRMEERTLELRKSLADLASEKKRFKEVLDMLPGYVILMDSGHHIVFTNQVFNKLFGIPAGKRCFEHLFDRDAPCEICEPFTVFQTKQPCQWEWNGPDGRLYQVSDFPFTDDDGSRLILETGEDITHKKNIETYVMRKVIETEEADRRRFAVDLHDDLGPTLSAIKMQLGLLNIHTDENQRLEILSQCKELLSESIEKMRDISNNLTPRLIESFGLETALNSLIQKIPHSGKISINLQSNLNGVRFKKETELHLYRIVSELINNTLKHAEASAATVQLDLTDDWLTMIYADNGKGYSVSKIQEETRGIGLHNIMHRVNLFDGQIEFLKHQGKITVIIRKKIAGNKPNPRE
ncbi:MAG: PAS domain-containing protein [Bacteroidota bacterium]